MTTAGPSPQQIEFLKKIADNLLVEFAASASSEVGRHGDPSQWAQGYELGKKMVTEGIINSPLPELKMEHIANKKGIEAVVSQMQFHGAGLNGPDNVQGEIREGGAIQTFHNCILKDAKPEVCVFMSHISTDVLCQQLTPELEPLWTHHMTNGDPFCQVVIKAKSTPYKDPDSLGRVIMKIPRVDAPKEILDLYRKHVLATFWVNTTLISKTILGPDKTMEILGQNAKRIGKNFGSSLIEANMLPARDISVMGSFINMFGEGSGMQGSITSMAPGVFTKEIIDCPFKSTPPELCKQWEAFFNGMLEKLNPELEFHYDRMMTMGDKTCKWVISKR